MLPPVRRRSSVLRANFARIEFLRSTTSRIRKFGALSTRGGPLMERNTLVRVTRGFLVAGLLVLWWDGALRGQDRRLLDSNGYVRDDAYARPLVPAADQKYLRIDGLKMKETLKEVVAISLKSRDDGNKYWGRIAGSKYETMTGDLMEAKFRKLGLTNIQRPEFQLPPQWVPKDWDLTATGSGKS